MSLTGTIVGASSQGRRPLRKCALTSVQTLAAVIHRGVSIGVSMTGAFSNVDHYRRPLATMGWIAGSDQESEGSDGQMLDPAELQVTSCHCPVILYSVFHFRRETINPSGHNSIVGSGRLRFGLVQNVSMSVSRERRNWRKLTSLYRQVA